MLESDPHNKLALYGLAMELANTGHPQQAIDQYERLLQVDPNYVAAYFHAGRAAEQMDDSELARGYYERGIQKAKAVGDRHALSELQAALDLLG